MRFQYVVAKIGKNLLKQKTEVSALRPFAERAAREAAAPGTNVRKCAVFRVRSAADGRDARKWMRADGFWYFLTPKSTCQARPQAANTGRPKQERSPEIQGRSEAVAKAPAEAGVWGWVRSAPASAGGKNSRPKT